MSSEYMNRTRLSYSSLLFVVKKHFIDVVLNNHEFLSGSNSQENNFRILRELPRLLHLASPIRSLKRAYMRRIWLYRLFLICYALEKLSIESNKMKMIAI